MLVYSALTSKSCKTIEPVVDCVSLSDMVVLIVSRCATCSGSVTGADDVTSDRFDDDEVSAVIES